MTCKHKKLTLLQYNKLKKEVYDTIPLLYKNKQDAIKDLNKRLRKDGYVIPKSKSSKSKSVRIGKYKL